MSESVGRLNILVGASVAGLDAPFDRAEARIRGLDKTASGLGRGRSPDVDRWISSRRFAGEETSRVDKFGSALERAGAAGKKMEQPVSYVEAAVKSLAGMAPGLIKTFDKPEMSAFRLATSVLRAVPAVAAVTTATAALAAAWQGVTVAIDAAAKAATEQPGMEGWSKGYAERAAALSRGRVPGRSGPDLSAWEAARAQAQTEIKPLSAEYQNARAILEGNVGMNPMNWLEKLFGDPMARAAAAGQAYSQAQAMQGQQLDQMKAQAFEQYNRQQRAGRLAGLDDIVSDSEIRMGALRRRGAGMGLDVGDPYMPYKTAADIAADRAHRSLAADRNAGNLTPEQYSKQADEIERKRQSANALIAAEESVTEELNDWDRYIAEMADEGGRLLQLEKAFDDSLSDVQRRMEASRTGVDARILEARDNKIDPGRIAELEKSLRDQDLFGLERATESPMEAFGRRVKEIRKLNPNDALRDRAIAQAYSQTVGRASSVADARLAAGGNIGSESAYQLLARGMAAAGPSKHEALQAEANAILRAELPGVKEGIQDLVQRFDKLQLVSVAN